MPKLKPLVSRVGTVLKNNLGYEMECINYNNALDITVKFLKTGTIVENVQWGQFVRGKVKDNASPSVYNIGIIGNVENAAKHPLYFTWMLMIKRCFITDSKDYSFCGARGITMDWNWRVFHRFIKDAVNMPGYDIVKTQKNSTIYLHENCKEYNSENCSFICSDLLRSLRKNTKKVKKVGNSYISVMMLNKKIQYLGSFKTREQAEQAYEKYLKSEVIVPAIKEGKLPEGFEIAKS